MGEKANNGVYVSLLFFNLGIVSPAPAGVYTDEMSIATSQTIIQSVESNAPPINQKNILESSESTENSGGSLSSETQMSDSTESSFTGDTTTSESQTTDSEATPEESEINPGDYGFSEGTEIKIDGKTLKVTLPERNTKESCADSLNQLQVFADENGYAVEVISPSDITSTEEVSTTVGNLNYMLDTDGKTATVSGTTASSSTEGVTINIPTKVTYQDENYPVTAIGDNAFNNFGYTGGYISLFLTPHRNFCGEICIFCGNGECSKCNHEWDKILGN